MSYNAVAQLFEHSSRLTPEGDSDPLMLLYRTLSVHTPDIARVVLAIHDLRILAKHMDDRLSPLLIDDVHGYDLAIASLLSVGGKGLQFLTTETKAYTIKEGNQQKKFSVRELLSGQERSGNEPGVPVPGQD